MRAQEEADQVRQELMDIETLFNSNREQVIDMLLTSVMNVGLDVPRVVKQNIQNNVEDWDDM